MNHRTTVRQAVLQTIRRWSQSGLTDEELLSKLPANYSPSSVRTRRRELADNGAVIATAQTRKTERGRNAIVWKSAV